MARTHTQLSREERWRLARVHAEGRARQIAATRHRELKRNAAGRLRATLSSKASALAAGADAALREQVHAEPASRQVAGRLSRAIYRFIHAQIARTKDYRFARPRGRVKRGYSRTRGARGSTDYLQERRPLSERPLRPTRGWSTATGRWT